MRQVGLAVSWIGLLGGCAHPVVARDGTLVFQENGAHGAAVVTAEGVEFHDVADVPHRIVSRDPYEPWRAPIGFIVPKSGRFTQTSRPTVLSKTGLAITLRPSDTRVPAWGGEMLVRIDVTVPAAEGEARWGEDVAIVLDGRGEDTKALCDAALSQLGGRDRILVLDAADAKVVVPVMPASNRSLVSAAIARHLATRQSEPGGRAHAVEQALSLLSGGTLRRVLFLSSAAKNPRSEAEEGLGSAMVPLEVISTHSRDPLERRARAVKDFVPASGRVAFRNVTLTFDASPSPSHVLEASGGDARWELEGGDLALGDVRAGDERAEVVRVTLPAWTAGESYALHVTAHFNDLAHGGDPTTMTADLRCVYDSDIERLAESRNGDVIAYASALATVARLDAAFADSAVGASHGDLRPVALLHARSLALLARDMHDPAAAAQAAMLEALVDVVQ
jgi:hypothetical protein